MPKPTMVITEQECRDLLGWHWKPRYEKSHWWLCKYARKRRVHNSVALAMGWPVGMRSAARAFITTRAELAWRLAEGWQPVAARGQTYLERGAVRVAVHPDIAGVLQLEIPGASRARERNQSSLVLVPARAREIFAAGMRKNAGRKRIRTRRPLLPV